MNLAELNKVARAMVAPGRGILAADESSGTIKKRFDAIGVGMHRGQPPRLSRDAVPRRRRDVEIHLRRHPLRRDHPPEGQGRHAAGQADREGRLASPASRSTRASSRCRTARARSSPKASTACGERLDEYRELGARFAKWRAVIDIGAGHPELRLHPHQRPCARALRRALPGARHRADRRAGSADGRRPRHRPLLRGHRVRAQGAVPGALLSARRARRHGAQAQHGDLRQEERQARRRRGSRREDREAARRPACRARCRASRSSPAASRTRKRPRISTP